ncbi:DNA cytosine methyltransferase [Parapedobacter tibetensis]|uniref:DNA cytosine methyltransferase n=1 Tax=Parapedobacter tibetensis TaxID=2972951 RepID=UPI00214DC710|nr:DNA cytosine methyltransferase [Parapedobacter tibetensis]
MATINYYLDKADKKGYCPIHLRINCSGRQIKVATGEKIKADDFDKEKQVVLPSGESHTAINHYLHHLKERAEELLNNSPKKSFTDKEIKEKLNDIAEAYKAESQVNIYRDQLYLYGRSYTFVDLFAGAGGFSEGFLQAQVDDKFFDFLLASDINENCELTHVVRYNHQLNLDTAFLRQDITEPDFLDNLLQRLNGKPVDVICGGPPCQSFSLAGKRRKFDKKDDLFSHYLEVIKVLQPKYFVMENVKGILTKEGGKVRQLILDEINSIVDLNEVPKLLQFIKELRKTAQDDSFILDCLTKRIAMEQVHDSKIAEQRETYLKAVEAKFKQFTTKQGNYKESKTDTRISTIRHGLRMLLRAKEIETLRRTIIKEKDQCNVDNDYFVDGFNTFITQLDAEETIAKVRQAFEDLSVSDTYQRDCHDILQALTIYTYSLEDCVRLIGQFCAPKQKEQLAYIMQSIRLYRIEAPFVANASDYGVPQNRERVLFIGCRKDQAFISTIPPTVSAAEKVSVFEALYDLDFVDNDTEAFHYEPVDIKKQYNGTSDYMQSLLRGRHVDGKVSAEHRTYAQWSKEGRLNGRFHYSPPFYVRDVHALDRGEKKFDALHNHKTSKQNVDVIKRLKIILREGDYKLAQKKLEKAGLSSDKRNYSVLKPDGQSPTVMTIPDDYVHYRAPRALTVREMARLQSFDDSFVFQGKRSTGGDKRKSEVPQYTLVGNAVPPLLARAVAMEILQHID